MENILTAIYEAWADRTPNRDIRIEIAEAEQYSIFDESVRTETDYEKALKVIDSVERKLGGFIRGCLEAALLANAPDKADAAFRFLQYAFRHADRKEKIMEDLTEPCVMRVFELNRKSRGEAHLILGFLRFEKLSDRVYVSKIGPVNDILPLIADHFADRFNTQAFLIYDEKRRKAVVYSPGHNWYFVEGEQTIFRNGLTARDEYGQLWKTYFDTIAIRERLNPLCQRTHCPLHFRAYMDEFTR